MSDQVKEAIDALAQTVADMRAAADERIANVEKRFDDVLTRDKEDRIAQAFAEIRARQDELEKAAKRAVALAEPANADKAEVRQAVESYLRRGEESSHLTRAAIAGIDSLGGYLTTTTLDQNVERLVKEISPMRSIAEVVTISTASYQRPIDLLGIDSGWVGEETARTETNTPNLGLIEPPMGVLYARPKATEQMLEDAFVNVEAWLAAGVAEEFAQKEGAAFISGDGAKKPRGFLAMPTASEATAGTVAPHGSIGYVPSGSAGAFGNQATLNPHPADVFLDTVARLRAPYRANARWMMNRFTEAAVAKIRDVDGNYIWRQGLTAGNPSTIAGYGVVLAEDMPNVATDAFPVAFGDFRAGYLIVDRAGIAVLRDPYSATPYVLFYSRKRVGGGVKKTEAIKLIRTGTA